MASIASSGLVRSSSWVGYVLQVIVCDASEEHRLSEPAVAEALASFPLSLKQAEVSAFAPLTDAQYTEWHAVWPITTRPLPRCGTFWAGSRLAQPFPSSGSL
jgi:hypothetical protein